MVQSPLAKMTGYALGQRKNGNQSWKTGVSQGFQRHKPWNIRRSKQKEESSMATRREFRRDQTIFVNLRSFECRLLGQQVTRLSFLYRGRKSPESSQKVKLPYMALNHFQKQIDISTNRKQTTFIYYVLHVAFRVFRATLEVFSYKYIVLLTAYCKTWNRLDL